MEKIRIGILREGKIPPDKRVALMPEQCVELKKQYPQVEICVQPSDVRAYTNKEYADKGLTLCEDLSDCDVLFGIKEVPVHLLIPDRTYFFFSHTLKKQPYNQKLLQTILEKRINLIDYEVLTDPLGNRLVAFGRFAGIVGTYNALLLYGKKFKLYKLKPAHKCFDMSEVFEQLKKIILPPIKIVVTGRGRVGKGAAEILDLVGIRKVKPEDYLNNSYREPVYTLLSSRDYNVRRDGNIAVDSDDFYNSPELYQSTFQDYLKQTDILISGAYWDPSAPQLFTREEMQSPDFKIQLIADITCDINGSIPSTIKPCTIYDPAYDYNPFSHSVEPLFSSEKNITVMAIDNLPGELPRDASRDFGSQLMKHVFPRLLTGHDSDGVLERATMTRNGTLTDYFAYLQDYVAGNANT